MASSQPCCQLDIGAAEQLGSLRADSSESLCLEDQLDINVTPEPSADEEEGGVKDTDNAKKSDERPRPFLEVFGLSFIEPRVENCIARGLEASPGGEDVALISFAANAALMKGFEEQSSPACAAAVIASAVNTLWGLDKEWTQPRVIDLYISIMQSRVSASKSRVERLLDGISIEGLFTPPPKSLVKLRERVKNYESSCEEDRDPVLEKLQLEWTQTDPPGDESSEDTNFAPLADGGGVQECIPETSELQEEEQCSARTTSSRGSSSRTLEDELKDLIRRMNGLEKLRGEKPSTGCIGNWGICQAIAEISASHSQDHDPGLRCITYMSKSVKSRVRLRLGDSEEQVETQWAALWSTFMRQVPSKAQTVLILHIKNHYAPVFALRVTLDGRRQLLTARKGQRPKHWIDFTELRNTLLGWSGYAVMAISTNLS